MTFIERIRMMNTPNPFPNEDGYDLWLRYPLIDNAERLAEYRTAIQRIVFPADSPTLIAARDELLRGLRGLLGIEISMQLGDEQGMLHISTLNNLPFSWET